MNEIEKYSNCIPFKYVCPECKTETPWQCPFVKLNPSISNEVKNVVKQETGKTYSSISDIKMEEDDDDDINIDESASTSKKGQGKVSYQNIKYQAKSTYQTSIYEIELLKSKKLLHTNMDVTLCFKNEKKIN